MLGVRLLGRFVGTDRISSTVMWAVRRDWPVDGTHEFVRPRAYPWEALRELASDYRYWRRGPIKPRLSVVQISPHDFALHGRSRRLCRAPDCPQG